MIVDGYIRVSQVAGRGGERFISTDVQREQIEAWARRNGVVIGQVLEELDESGSRSDRPLLLRAIGRVERGETEGVVVAYLSRFGRSLIDGLAAIKRIQEAGGTFVSVGEGLDFSTDAGRLVLRVLFSIAEWEFDRTRSNWDAARHRAIARGTAVARAPFGYTRTAAGQLEPRTDLAPVLRELFHRRADGARLCELRAWLDGLGIRTPRGNSRWNEGSIARMLRNRTYLGELQHGQFENVRAHPPIVSEAAWSRAQPGAPAVAAARSRRPALLKGIVRCAGCKRILRSSGREMGSSAERRLYVCFTHNGTRCPATVCIRDSAIEPYVEEIFWQELNRQRSRPRVARRRAVEREVERRGVELVAYRDNGRLPITLGAERFAEGVARRVRRVEAARVELAQLAEGEGAESLPPAQELRAAWPTMTVPQRRSAIGKVIECAFVRQGREPCEERVTVFLRGRGPKGLPPDNPRRPVETQPFDPARSAPGASLRRPPPDWSEEAVRTGLRKLLGGLEMWPPFMYFQEHGQAALYVQLDRYGGPRRWASELGVTYVPRTRTVAGWPADRIRAELRTYLEGKTAWPSCRQFGADGRRVLRDAVRWRGGAEYWAAEMGVALPLLRRAEPQRWPYPRMKADVQRLAGRDKTFPRSAQFEAAGLRTLEKAIRHHGLREQLAADLGLKLPAKRPGRKPAARVS